MVSFAEAVLPFDSTVYNDLFYRAYLYSGTLPSSLGNLTSVEYLDLSYNSWSGEGQLQCVSL